MDAENSFVTVPVLFADEPGLAQGWELGWQRFHHFDIAAWREKCRLVAAQTANTCGLSADLYNNRFSSAVDCLLGALPAAHRTMASHIAMEFDYATPQERQQDDRFGRSWASAGMGLNWGAVRAAVARVEGGG
ncbi:hypothetical protein [Pseudoduganella lurida]|uniref:hypothetical protein n=1 Tax=Pseudoduganella lurida TaxID=1036180 RepID=UPI001E39843E|nr:hypothetical protein [Pseudoduganella lurida]